MKSKRILSIISGVLALLSLFSVLFTLGGCKVPEEEIVFKGVTNIRVKSVDKGEAIVLGDALFYNPNKVKMKLKKVDVGVDLEGKKVAHIYQDGKNLAIGATSEFSVPLDVRISLRDEGLLNNLISILGGKRMELHYKGYIRASAHGVTVKVPVDYKGMVRL
jgi:LEA14-like dessication related protein